MFLDNNEISGVGSLLCLLSVFSGGVLVITGGGGSRRSRGMSVPGGELTCCGMCEVLTPTLWLRQSR